MGKVVIYTSSISFNPKTRNHTGNLKYILESKGIEYEEVSSTGLAVRWGNVLTSSLLRLILR